MTSLAVQLNYNNINTAAAAASSSSSSSAAASREKHRITRNPNSSLNTINSNNNSINNGSGTHMTFSNINGGGGFAASNAASTNLQQFNNFSLTPNTKMPSSNIIYNLKTGNGIGGTIMESK